MLSFQGSVRVVSTFKADGVGHESVPAVWRLESIAGARSIEGEGGGADNDSVIVRAQVAVVQPCLV